MSLGDTIARQMGLRCMRKVTEQDWEQASKQRSFMASELVPASRILSCVSTLAFLSDEVWHGDVSQTTPLSPLKLLWPVLLSQKQQENWHDFSSYPFGVKSN